MPYLGPKPVNVRSASSLIVDGNLTAGQTALENGLTVDKDGNTVATFDRATSNGTIIDLQKDGSTVGSIGTLANLAYFGNSGANSNGVIFTSAGIEPFDSSNGTSTKDGDIDLGASNQRFQDLYLSGGVYLGGTGAANQLDDYEEGTWTPAINYQSGGPNSPTQANGSYTKIGRLVNVNGMIVCGNTNSGSGLAYLAGLPFTVSDTVADTSVEANGVVGYFANLGTTVNTITISPINGQTYCEIYTGTLASSAQTATVSTFNSGAQIRFSITYYTTA